MILGIIYCKDGILNNSTSMFNGKPLIAYTIETASRCTMLDDLIVSTDSQDIADVAMHYGVKVPFLLSSNFTANATSEWALFLNVVEAYEKQFGKAVTYLVVMDVTAPLTTTADIEGALKLALLYPETDVVVTGYRSTKNPYFNMVELNKKGYAEIVRKETEPVVRLQDAPKVFVLSGAALIIKKSALYNYSYWSQAVCRVYEIPRSRALDVTEETDYELIKFRLSQHTSV